MLGDFVVNTETPVTPREARFIAAFLTYRTQEEAAAALRCHVRTYQRTIERPHVQAAIGREAMRRLRRISAGLCRHADRCLDSLGAIGAGDVARPSAARVSAARTIVELALRVVDVDHEERLAEVEAAVAALRERPPGSWRPS